MNKIILLAALPVLFLSACKKEVKKPTSKELHRDECLKPFQAEYGYKLYYQGALQINTTSTLLLRENKDGPVLLLQTIQDKYFYIDINCENGTFYNIEYPNVLGKVYGMDSLVLEDANYKTVLINHK